MDTTGSAGGVFDDLVGQERVVEELRGAVVAAAAVARGGRTNARTNTGGSDVPAGSMAQAWLFTGPPGSGRSNAARSFAAALQCPHSVSDGCGHCDHCHQVLAGTHADVEVVQPAGLSYKVGWTRQLVLRAAKAPSGGAWQIVLFEDADRCTEQAANALLKAIEEPPPRTIWLLCSPSPDDLVATIRSRCRQVSLRTPPSSAVAEVLTRRDGVDESTAAFAARAAQGHVGRARRLATDEDARRRREEVLGIPMALQRLDGCLDAAARLVDSAKAESDAATKELDAAETGELRQALGDQSGGQGTAKRLPRGSATALRELEDRQKSRATRVQRDALDRALLDLAGFYRDVLVVQLGASVELANLGCSGDLRTVAEGSPPEATLRRLDAIMDGRERLAANANPRLTVEALMLTLRAPFASRAQRDGAGKR